MSDHIDRAERAAREMERATRGWDVRLAPDEARDLARALDAAGLLATPEHDARSLREAADAVPVDLWCTYGMVARTHVEGFQEWLRERAVEREWGASDADA